METPEEKRAKKSDENLKSYNAKVKRINNKIKGDRSLRNRLKKTSKTVNGYSQSNSTVRALGFSQPFDLPMPTNSHLINKSDLVNSVNELIESGYDIILPKRLADKDLNS